MNKFYYEKCLSRGLSQVLYNYLPEKTFDLKGGVSIGKIKSIKGEPIKNLRNTSKIIKSIERYVKKWEGNENGFGINYKMRPEYVFIKPINLKFDIFPLVFKCPVCKRIYSYKSVKQIEKYNKNLLCQFSESGCNKSKLRQVYQIAIHQCGNIKGLVPNAHSISECNCKDWYKNIAIDDKRSQRLSDFRWKCLKCKKESEIEFYCDEKECNEKNKIMTIVPHRASKCYFAHSVRCIDVSDGNGEEDLDNRINQYIGNENNNKSHINFLKLEKEKCGINDSKKMILDELISELELKSNEGFDIEIVTDETKRNFFEYSEVINSDTITSYTIKRKEELFNENGEVSKFINLKDNRKSFNEIGIKDITLIEDFPVITGMFGYTRLSSDYEFETIKSEKHTTLNSFRFNADNAERGQVPIYIDNGKCEALMFSLSYSHVIKWLSKNELIEKTDNIDQLLKDENYAKHWILKQINNPYYPEQDSKKIEKFIYSLVHSMAHIFMKGIEGISGFELVGLSEYLFVPALSFVIFSNKTDFSIGGLHTLFEIQLSQLLNKIMSPDLRICMHDPLCKEKESACHACIYLPEISCYNFNKGVSRKYIYGSGMVKGFWEGFY